MHKFEYTFQSLNSVYYPKSITVFAIAPGKIGPDTGVMLFTHGWGGNRFQHQDKMEFASERFNLVCLCTEYRQSGFDFDPVKGSGSLVPYDASFYQVFDVLNALRAFLTLRPEVNRKRIFHYGGSQGGHIALLSAIFAPGTFAFVYASSPMTHIDASKYASAGREFSSWELNIRDVTAHAGMIACPVFLEHGTNDENVPCASHTKVLEGKLKSLGKDVLVRYYENGGHDLQPATNKLQAFKTMMIEHIFPLKRENPDDIIQDSKVVIPCGEKTLHIDWSKSPGEASLFCWK